MPEQPAQSSAQLVSGNGSVALKVGDGGGVHQLTATEVFEVAHGMGMWRGYDVLMGEDVEGLRFSRKWHQVRLRLGREGFELGILLGGHFVQLPGIDHAVHEGVWGGADPEGLAHAADFVARLEGASHLECVLAARLVPDLVELTDDSTDTETPLDVVVGPAFAGVLRPYQSRGLAWLASITDSGLGGILADDMGLGKTVTVAALMTRQAAVFDSSKFLVVMPLSLMDNWHRELARFAPALRVYRHHGGDRAFTPSALCGDTYDVAITTYGTLVNDQAVLAQVPWRLVVCDEAQAMKNAESQRWHALASIRAESRIMVTGTPVENRASDVCSLASLCVPQIAPDPGGLDSHFEGRPSALSQWLGPILLRRRVQDVRLDLPDKTEQSLWLTMTTDEIVAYNEILDELQEGASILAVLQRLRMACAHPGLGRGRGLPAGSELFDSSSKISALRSRLEEEASVGEKSLVFVEWTELSDALLAALPGALGIDVQQIDGRTASIGRQRIVDRFNELPMPAVLLLNPKAAGVGLNLQGASRVHHLTLGWNPALEDQATARAYRSGQERTVFVTRYAYPSTIDELMIERLEQKRELIDEVIESRAGYHPTADDVARIRSLRPVRGALS